jgi:probable HAF family extracellular repeat protein
MKSGTWPIVGVTALLLGLTSPAASIAQDIQTNRPKHHHYKLVDLGTLGGPQSYLVPGSGQDFSGSSVLNGAGTVVGFADTSASDPFCLWDCYLVHAFAAQSNGRLSDLEALPGGGSSVPMWISSNGLIAGLSENGRPDPFYPFLPQIRAVLWHDGKITDLGVLPLPEGGYQSEANSVNSSGQVVGAALSSIPDPSSMEVPSPASPGPFWLWGGIMPPYLYQMRAFLWDEEHGMQDLGTLPGGNNAQAILINEAGQVVGYSYTGSTQTGACFPLATASFIWEKGKGMTDLGGFGGTCTLATALNKSGQIVGESYRTGDQSAPAFLWEKGSIHELEGSFGGDFSGAFAINEQGEAVGFGTLPGNATFHAALWTNVRSIADLGVIGSDLCSYAAAINERAQVVGTSLATCDADTGTVRAILWEGGSLFDLNALIPLDSPLHLGVTSAINDQGEIAGTGGDANGNEHAFLLIPCDDNHPNIEGCDYSLTDANASPHSAVSSGPMNNASPTPISSIRLRHLLRSMPQVLASMRRAGMVSEPTIEAAVPLAITSGTPPSGHVGKPYEFRCSEIEHCLPILAGFSVTAAGGVQPYSWSWTAQPGSSLPPGLMFSDFYGLDCFDVHLPAICGKPTTAGSYNVLVTVKDSASPPNHASASYTIHIFAQ